MNTIATYFLGKSSPLGIESIEVYVYRETRLTGLELCSYNLGVETLRVE